MNDYIDMVVRWAEWAETVIEGWPDDPKLAEPDWTTLEDVASRAPRSPSSTAGAR
jgi:hypothetical protein